jgi:acylphosphatase
MTRRADELGLVGWVMNGDDEMSVQLVAEGQPAALDALEQLLRAGPRGARVASVQASRSPASGEFTRFAIVRS